MKMCDTRNSSILIESDTTIREKMEELDGCFNDFRRQIIELIAAISLEQVENTTIALTLGVSFNYCGEKKGGE